MLAIIIITAVECSKIKIRILSAYTTTATAALVRFVDETSNIRSLSVKRRATYFAGIQAYLERLLAQSHELWKEKKYGQRHPSNLFSQLSQLRIDIYPLNISYPDALTNLCCLLLSFYLNFSFLLFINNYISFWKNAIPRVADATLELEKKSQNNIVILVCAR